MPANPAQLPFKEAIAFFKNKIQLPSASWADIWAQQNSVAFVVAGAQSDALLSDFYSALKNAQANGTGYAAFAAEFDSIVAKNKWAHNGKAGWRSRIIYDTNMTQAHNAGRWQQMWDLRDLRPYLRYRHTSMENPRLIHKAWDGKVLPITDPWWNTHTPQNGYGCKCRLESLSRNEAQADWQSRGRTGPDEAPPMDWQDVTVGKNGANPRTVRTPAGVDPGFAYNPGKSYLEPHTVPPLTGYDKPLQSQIQQGKSAGALLAPDAALQLRKAVKFPANGLIDPPFDPKKEVSNFLDVFGATLEQGAVFIDKTESPVAISKALFIQGDDKTADHFKWLADGSKADRVRYLNLLAMTIADPAEIWWAWEAKAQSKADVKAAKPKEWILKRRYLKVFEIDGEKKYAITSFTWGKDGWSGSTAFVAKDSQNKEAAQYFNDQRKGRLVWPAQ